MPEQESPPPIELVEGYGVFISRRALDDAVDSCRHTATRLMRNLIGVFFSDVNQMPVVEGEKIM